ncbi:hypothetical protein D3C79_775200 [compost metagenome]
MATGQGDDTQAQVVVAHDHIQQWMYRRAQVGGLEVDGQAVLDLRHLVGQVLACTAVQLMVEGKHRQTGEQQHQCRAHQADAQAQAQ